MLDLLANKQKSNLDEAFLFERLLKWIYVNEKKCEHSIIDILKEVDFKNVCLKDFERILAQNNFVLKIQGCSEFFRRIIK